MKIAYITLILILLVIMLIVGQRARSKNTRLAQTLIRLTYAVALTVLTSVMALFVSSDKVALFMQSMHYAATEWMLIFLLVFFEEYADGFEGIQAVRFIVFLYSGISSVILISNAWFNHVVYCEYRVVNGESYRMFRTLSPWYEIHGYFSYAIALLALMVVVMGTIKSKSYYRIKYFPAAVTFIITIALEVVCTIRDSLMDFALFGYLGLAIYLIYYSVYHVNGKLINQTLSLVTAETAGGIVCFDILGKCIYANETAYEFYADAKELADFEEIFSQYEYGIDKPNQIWNESHDAEESTKYFEIGYKRLEDNKSNYTGCFFYLFDRTEDVQKLEEAKYQATHDTLTGLYNERGFTLGVEEILKTMPNEDFLIVTVDIKDFKLINDLFGYEVGDKVLKTMADSLKKSLPYYALSCRKTSDHFYFCIKRDDFEEKRVKALSKKIGKILDKYNYQIVLHFGIYQIQKQDKDVAIMCDCARLAMYQIKEDYDRQFEYYDESMMDEILKVKELVKRFDEALKHNHFKMFLQPQVNPKGKVTGAEALARWIDPELGMISPGEFIPVFEDAGLIHKLDLCIWEQAVQTLNKWKGTDKEDFYISINISTKDFMYIDIYSEILRLIEEYDVEPGKLKLEITESVFMIEPERQLALIADLQSFGFIVEIDDFGSGYSSLNILKDMNADVLKIDMGFLRKTKDEKRSRSIIDSVIKMAKLLDMEIISEGVEEKEQVEFLTEAGCDLFQGYFFDKPMSLEDFESKY